MIYIISEPVIFKSVDIFSRYCKGLALRRLEVVVDKLY